MRQSEPIRRSAIVGRWYPSDPAHLTGEVDRYLAAVDESADLAPTAIIAPHAGLIYSGPVGAYAYRALSGLSFEAVVLVGPSHFVAFDGVSIYPRGAFATPWGPMRVDQSLATRLLASPVVREYPRAHQREHSLEMQLPFLHRVLPDTPIVPLLMGRQTRETVEALTAALTATLADRRALLVASTDLSHYFDATRAAELDARVVDYVNAFDPEGLLDELESYPEPDRGRWVACGGGPAVAVMQTARALGATRSSVLRRADSAAVSGDLDQVVGYLAAVIGPGGTGT